MADPHMKSRCREQKEGRRQAGLLRDSLHWASSWGHQRQSKEEALEPANDIQARGQLAFFLFLQRVGNIEHTHIHVFSASREDKASGSS